MAEIKKEPDSSDSDSNDISLFELKNGMQKAIVNIKMEVLDEMDEICEITKEEDDLKEKHGNGDEETIDDPQCEVNINEEKPVITEQPHPVFLIKSKNKKTESEEDEDYLPPKTKPKASIFRTAKTLAPDVNYSAEVTSQIEIVTISEEERQLEYKATLASRANNRYVCEPCAIGYAVREAYLVHLKVHSPESGDHECDICHSRLKTAHVLYQHKLRHYRRYRCLACGSTHKDRDAASCHVMKAHVNLAFVCTYCGKGFRRPKYLKSHVDQHHERPQRFECPYCPQVLYDRSWYRSHVRTHNIEVRPPTNKYPFKCTICKRDFKTQEYLDRHTAIHTAQPVCPLCAQALPADDLPRHLAEQHDTNIDVPLNFTCPHCPRVLTTRGMLTRHVARMHLDRTKKYQCDHCKRFYYTKAEVRSHILWSHLRARVQHSCHCGRVFRTPARLRDHNMRVHLNLPKPKLFECGQCGKAFQTRAVLLRHEKSHTDETHPCDQCGMTFKTKSYVKIHYKLKHLNMTRAEIKAEMKRPKPRTIEDCIGLKIHQIVKDPLNLDLGDVRVKQERDADIQVPLFETFIDILPSE